MATSQQPMVSGQQPIINTFGDSTLVRYQSSTKGTFGGHKKDKIYGTLDCAGAKMWIEKGHYVKQRVFFADEETAIAAGYRPCFGCLREKYKEWKAKK
jgi:hypothetical protein